MRDEAVSEIFRIANKEERAFLFEHEAKTLCKLYGMPVTKITVASTVDETIDAAEKIGYPIVLKIVSPQVLHKSDAGGILLNIKDADGIQEGFNKIIQNVKTHIPDAEIKGILIQEMAPNGTEVIIGSTRDSTFGPTIMFGIGGIFVEILKDVSFRLAPITVSDATEMIKEIKAYKILEGVRGAPPVDQEAIKKILMATSKMLMECPEIRELDMNPILVYENGAKIVDARVIL
jgi:acetyl-CoA synthetase (ADP-forming)